MISQTDRGTLVLRSGRVLPIILMFIGVVASAADARRVLQHPDAIQLVILSLSVTPIVWAFLRFGFSITADRQSASIVIRRWLPVWTAKTPDIQSVVVSVAHEGPREVLRAMLFFKSGDSRALVGSPTGPRSATVIAVAKEISALLSLPLQRAGESDAADPSLQKVLKLIGAPEFVGDGMSSSFDCPRCKNKNVTGVAYERVERKYGIAVWRTNWVRCLACGTDLYLKCPAEEFSRLSPEERRRVVLDRLSLIVRALALLSLILSVVPILGVVLSVTALSATYRRGGGWKRVSLIALIISLLATAWVSILLNLPARNAHVTPPHPRQDLSDAIRRN